ncbi:hypothetical protein ATANTOWER_020184 [Ataeniobius toweri]|uniref:long-chain-fatty-acid--CoA ligase n=1 Tax=Ataeniobius toweri TaxID=208326 RepID=A0ABU7B2I2_9TELE|nr:hypothetical protein [Ataeniobius toweri]
MACETGLLVGKITRRSPFIGYAGNKQQTEKKRLYDVMEKGDLYFNTGDLLMFDHENFVYFQDRVGDTFRWKGENVATSEVADILTVANCVLEANVYGVKVEGHEGRIGMAAITLREGETFDSADVYKQVVSYLPAYARPRFLRIQVKIKTKLNIFKAIENQQIKKEPEQNMPYVQIKPAVSVSQMR